MANPTLLSMPIAKNGDKNSIPSTLATDTGVMSQEYGFPQSTSTPLASGGHAPDRKDFNGAFNLLSGVAFYAQKGWTFLYDATQDYYAGCVVIDPTDGNRYECIANMTAGTVAPSDDTSGTYWQKADKINLTFDNVVHHSETYTSSGTFTAPVTGTYRITLQGGGGGGGGATNHPNYGIVGGGGGGEGAEIIFYENLTAGTSYAYTIGAGGAGGTSNGTYSSSTDGTGGGASSITVNGNAYVAGGGGGGSTGTFGGRGGLAKINDVAIPVFRNQSGCNSWPADGTHNYSAGGNGGGRRNGNMIEVASYGGGGAGGSKINNYVNGQAGGDGYITFEYFAQT